MASRGTDISDAVENYAKAIYAIQQRSGTVTTNAIAERLDPESEVTLPYLGRLYRYPIRFFLVHAAEHGVEHRTEVKLNLADAGFTTPDLDGWEYGEWADYGSEVAAP